jgi:ubiquinone biosynthesis protein COQ4
MTETLALRKNNWPAAWRALMKLRSDPDNTDAVFEIFQALPGSGVDTSYQTFAGSEVGARVLSEKRVLLEKLCNRDWLASLPAGTLGRVYFEFTEREKITADGLVEASKANKSERRDQSESAQLFYARRRDMHDLEHVVTGYGRDLVGEASILTFDVSQSWYTGLAVICALAWFEGSKETRATQRGAWRRGKQALWLGVADWERHLEEPLEQVREELGLGEPPSYEASRSSGAPAISQAGAN